jgi:hypothetical protein
MKSNIKPQNCFLFIVFLILLLQTGCGNNVGLGGKVAFEDGQPLTAGTVCFETSTYLARGTIRENGTYTVGSVTPTDGIPPGNYNVYISNAVKYVGINEKTNEEIWEPFIDKKFTSADTSGLTIDVSASTKKFDIVVTPYAPKKKK